MSFFSFLEGQKVLVVEDDELNQELMEDIFEDSGCLLEVVGTGVIAVEKCRETEYQLILMDIQMPEMDGYEATKKIRAQEKSLSRSPAPIIALTANALSGDRELCLEHGADEYLSKPIRIQDLKKKVKAVLSQTSLSN